MFRLGALAVLSTCFVARGTLADDGFTPMFNGEDLAGWTRVNTAPSTWSVADGPDGGRMLVCTGKPIGELRTTRMYQNFVMELEWRHMKPRGNAGVFVWADDITARGVPFHRGIEVQVLENAYGQSRGYTTHGDIFPIHGATMTPVNGRGGKRAFPTEERSKPSPEWNHYRIECRDGDISLAVNGKVVTRGQACSPRKGYICLESEGGVVHYRNVRIKELPDTPVDPEHVAITDRGYRCLYQGIDLTGWEAADATHWHANDWVLHYDGKAETGTLTTKESFDTTNLGLLFDLRLKPDSGTPKIEIGGLELAIDTETFGDALGKPGRWNRFEVAFDGRQAVVSINGDEARRVKTAGSKGSLSFHPDGPLDVTNVYVREAKAAE